jgi:hypothetical protein
VNVTAAGQPMSNGTVNYFVSNKDGIVVIRGQAQHESTGQFHIDLTADMTSRLLSGPNQIKIFATSNEALRPDIYSNTILAVPGTSTNQTTYNEQAESGQFLLTAQTSQQRS